MQQPTIVVDTGTLLTLLLGGEGSHGPGYTGLLVDLAKKGLARIVIPDMVAAEFLGVLAPVYRDDMLGKRAFISESSVPFGFSKAKERLELLRGLLAINGAEIMPTPCGAEYLSRIQDLLAHNDTFRRNKDREWPPSEHELRERLSKPHSHLYKAVKNNALVDGHGHEVSSGKQDRGELAVADCLRILQSRKGDAGKHFVLFEGSDVRGRIIQRLLSEKGSPAYHQLHGEVLPEFNPNSQHFRRKDAAALGDINFLSTKAFIAGYMKAAKELSVAQYVRAAEPWYILHPDEAKKNGYLNDGYRELMRQVTGHGLGRAYERYRDRPISDMRPEDEDEPAMVRHVPQNAPWMQQISSFAQDTEQREALRVIVHDFVKKRQKALLRECEESFESILRTIPKMSVDTACSLLLMLNRQMAEVASRVERVFQQPRPA